MTFTLEELSLAKPWPIADTLALEGTMKAALLRDWGVHVTRRFGPDEADHLRAALGVDRRQLADSPDPDLRVPAGWQLALTRLIAERHLGGDLLRLEPLLMEDARRRPVSLAERIARKALSPRRLLGQSSRIHAAIFNCGQCQAEVGKHDATLTWTGASMFAEPTWRVIQIFALRALYEVLDHRPPSIAADEVPDGFRVRLTW